jgi:hypothetical protein
MEYMPILWWGYKHVDDSIHVKRYFDPRDIEEAKESPFVFSVHGPWEVASRNEAIEQLRRELGE